MPEVDSAIYRDVESLLYRGFIPQRGTVGTARIAWKSVNHREYDLLALAYGDDPNDPEFQAAFLAKSVFLWEGHNLLRGSRELIETFQTVPKRQRAEILQGLKRLNERAHRATHLVEAYAYEKISRWRWSQLKGHDLMSPSLTGFEGTETLGLNWAQLVWTSLNQADDALEVLELQWDNAKFIGSCFTKLNRVYAADTKRRDDMATARERRKDELLRRWVLREEDSTLGPKELHGMKVARNPEELIYEIQNQLKGERDFHDQVVEAAEAYYASQVKAKEEREQEITDEIYSGGASLDSPLTRKEALQAVKEHFRRQLTTEENPMAQQVMKYAK